MKKELLNFKSMRNDFSKQIQKQWLKLPDTDQVIKFVSYNNDGKLIDKWFIGVSARTIAGHKSKLTWKILQTLNCIR